jgi:Secretin and TonB N terminus short domain
MSQPRSLLFFTLALLVLLPGGLDRPAAAQPAGDKTATELWLDAHRDPHEKRYFGEPIDLSLKGADLVETLRSFAEIGRFNLIIQPGVQGKVTVELKQVPWDQALEQILKISNLSLEISGGDCARAPGDAGPPPAAGGDPEGSGRRCVAVRSRFAPERPIAH